MIQRNFFSFDEILESQVTTDVSYSKMNFSVDELLEPQVTKDVSYSIPNFSVDAILVSPDVRKDSSFSKHLLHKKGRPTQKRELEIKRTLRFYYENSVSAVTTRHETGLEIKTIRKYFSNWYNQITQSEEKDFLKRCKQQKEQTILTYDKQILSLVKHIQKIESDIKKARKEDDFSSVNKLYQTYIKIVEEFRRFVSDKINLVNGPLADTQVDLEMKKTEKNDAN